MNESTLSRSQYSKLLHDIKEKIRSAQYSALKMVNKGLISLYWDIGRMIIEQQQGDTWGKSVVEGLARDLQKDFPGVQGFSSSNLWRMKVFYHIYSQNKKLAPMVREISWTHNVVILERCKDDLEREFYIRMTRKYGWTKNVLIHHVENRSYEKTLLGQTNFDKTVLEQYQAQAKLAVKDEYTFDFLELGDDHGERELEKALTGKIENFLREMGGLFAFVGSQYRLEVGGK
jgi:predicted nuclease of restriction endonuclease-like (RecB) superfamily